MEMSYLIGDGVHMLSGIGEATIPLHEGWDDMEVNAIFLVIDDVTFCCYEDPDDGFRSFGIIEVADKENIEKSFIYHFEPQKVIVKNEHVEEEDEDRYLVKDYYQLVLKDAILDKEVLRVGTDHTDSYYPMAIFHYNPMNLYENVKRSIMGEI